MKFKITEDQKFLKLVDSTQLEFEQLESSFSKKVDNYFILKKKLPHWDGVVKFMDRYNRIPIGLWAEVNNLAKKYNFPISIEGSILDPDYDPEDFDAWVKEHFKNPKVLYPRYYQIEGAKRILKYRLCTEDISTSGGKTLLAYMVFYYLLARKKINKLVYIVPNVDLVEQSEDKFYDYDKKCGIEKPIWESACIYGGSKKRRNEDQANIVFGTFQSLSKKGEDYFSEFDAVCVDECLHPDTLITMEDFSKKKIKDVKKGERVWTVNEKTKKWEIKEIDFVYKNLSKDQQMYEIVLENDKIIKITGNHKVYTSKNIWKRVDELSNNEEIISIDMMNI